MALHMELLKTVSGAAEQANTTLTCEELLLGLEELRQERRVDKQAAQQEIEALQAALKEELGSHGWSGWAGWAGWVAGLAGLGWLSELS